MPKITCRYCPLYCRSKDTPIYGHCTGHVPPKFIRADTWDCPCHSSDAEVKRLVEARGFGGHDLCYLKFYGVSEDGIRTRYFWTLEDLKNNVQDSGVHYSFYVCYIDSHNRVFASSLIKEGVV